MKQLIQSWGFALADKIFPKITGYDITEDLYAGAKSQIYRGIRLNDQKAVVIKLLNHTEPTHTELLNFRHQYTLIKGYRLVGVVIPIALETWQNRLALIMPDFGAIDLHRYQQQSKQRLKPADFLNIAVQLAEALEQLHQVGITHKDIKPSNIIINSQSKHVALIDFSIASQLSKEHQSLQSPEALSGTLNYMSPEQTGRMNRGVDYRTDFYSLGVTCYELLSGQLPFASNNAQTLVYSHLARTATPLIDLKRNIPEVISNIVQKLMAKNAEQRYQSGAGLKVDLLRCAQALETDVNIAPFTLGQGDWARRFRIDEILYGRSDEIKTLLNTFERIRQGHTEAILIPGLSGIGKTALVNEVHKPMTQRRGYFIKGKFDQLKQNTPFSAMTQALTQLVLQLLQEDPEQQKHWQEKLLLALGQQAQLLIDWVPELVQLIGEQPAVETLSGAASAHRFHHLMRQFIQVIADPEHPLVLFLDDLQWIDTATLQLLPVLLTGQVAHSEAKTPALLFIGAYRDNETPLGHPLLHTLEMLKQNGLPIRSINLPLLTSNDTCQLVADACHCNNEQAKALSQVVFDKTAGNPFFIHQFLLQAAEEALFQYDFEREFWRYELRDIQQLASSDDVVAFMVRKIRQLAPETQLTLQRAACIGARFDLYILAVTAPNLELQNTTKINVQNTLINCAQQCWQAVQNQLLVPIGEHYKHLLKEDNIAHYTRDELVSLSQKIHYRFSHDHIQQSAYSMIAEAEKAPLHLHIARLMQQHVTEPISQEKLFQLVSQFNTGRALIVQWDERLHLAKWNLKAGAMAKQATAYESARQFLHTGMNLLGLPDNEACWQSDYTLTLRFTEGAAEVAFLLGDYRQQQHFGNELLRHAQSLTDTIKIHQMQCLSCIAQSDPQSAIDYALPILKQCGIEFPMDPTPEHFQQELAKTQTLLGERAVATLIDLPLMTDPLVLAGVRLLEKLDVALYITAPALFPLAVFKRIQLALNYGNAPEIVPFYGAYGFILSGLMNDIQSGYEFGLLSLALLEKLNAQAQKPLTYVNVYANRFYKHSVRDSIAPLRDGSHYGLQVGDLHYAATTLYWANTYSFFSAVELNELKQIIKNDQLLIINIHQDVCLIWSQILQQMVLNLSDDSQNPQILAGDVYEIGRQLPQHQQANDISAMAFAQIHQTLLAYLFHDYQLAQSTRLAAAEILDAVQCTLFIPEFTFYDALIQLAIYPEQSTELKNECLAQVQIAQTSLARLARHAPMNFQHKWALVEAERCRVLKQPLEVIMTHYDQAITLAQDNHYTQEEALASELAGRFYLSIDKHIIAKTYLKQAYYAWARWGSKAKTRQLERHYPQFFNLSDKPHSVTPHSGTLTQANNSMDNSLDIACVMKCSQSLTAELTLAGLLNKILTAVTENMGAMRTVLLLAEKKKETEHWIVAAEFSLATQERQILKNVPLEHYHKLPMTLLEQCMQTHHPIIVDNACDPLQPFYSDAYFSQHRELQSVLSQPVLSKGQLIGLLYLENNLTAHVFHQEHLKIINMLSAQAAISIENTLLYEQLEQKVEQRTEELQQALEHVKRLSITDELTGLYNRRYFNQVAKREFAGIKRLKKLSENVLVYCMIDVDFFKQYNDTYGHKAGDTVLKTLGILFNSAIHRSTDYAFRLGGEEFGFLLRVSDTKQIRDFFNGVRQTIENKQIPHCYNTASDYLTASFGYVVIEPGSNVQDMDTIYHWADKALYQAKEQGRNQVVEFYSPKEV